MEENKTFTECRNEEIYHAGILGMKWGVRRYQNKDGSLTAAGKKRYGTKANFEKVQAAKKAAEKYNSKAAKARRKANARTAEEVAEYRKKMGLKTESKSDADSKPKVKTIKDMTDEELASGIRRAQLEQQYSQLHPQQVSSGKKFLKETLGPKLSNAAAQVATEFATKKAKDWLGLNDKGDSLSGLKKEVEKLNLQKQLKELKKKDTSEDIDDLLKKYGDMSEAERDRYKNAAAVKGWEGVLTGKKNKGGGN